MNTAKKPKCPKCNSTSVIVNANGLICKKCSYENKQDAKLQIKQYG